MGSGLGLGSGSELGLGLPHTYPDRSLGAHFRVGCLGPRTDSGLQERLRRVTAGLLEALGICRGLGLGVMGYGLWVMG